MHRLQAYSLSRWSLIGGEGATTDRRRNLRPFILCLTQKWAAGERAGGATCDGLRFVTIFAFTAEESGERAPNLTGAAMANCRAPRRETGGGALNVTGGGGYGFAFLQIPFRQAGAR